VNLAHPVVDPAGDSSCSESDHFVLAVRLCSGYVGRRCVSVYRRASMSVAVLARGGTVLADRS
jgi:hypothetical protein